MKRQIIIFRFSILALIIILLCVSVVTSTKVKAVYLDCIAYDTFTDSDGSLGNTDTTGPSAESCPERTWTGSTYAIASNKAGNTPTLGSDLFTDGALENWTSSTNLTSWNEITTTSTVNQESSVVHGGSYSARFDIVSSGNVRIDQTVSSTAYRWYQVNYWLQGSNGCEIFVAALGNVGHVATGLWVNWTDVIRSSSSSLSVLMNRFSGANCSEYLDDLTVKELTTSTLFATVPTSTSDNFIIEADATVATGTNAGIVVNMDSSATPLYYVIAYHDGKNIKLDKVVNGVYSNLINTLATYSAGAKIRLVKMGTTYKLYYNGTQRGADQTISDAGIISNTIHGLFSTYSGNTFDNFYIMDNAPTPTPTNTNTSTFTPTFTPTNTSTFTPTNTPTDTPTFTPTFTPTNTPTFTPTFTFTPTVTRTPTSTFTAVPTAYFDGVITYGETSTTIAVSLLCMVVILGFIAWIVITTLQRRRKS